MGWRIFKKKELLGLDFGNLDVKEYSFTDLFRFSKVSAFSADTIIDDPEFTSLAFFKELPKTEIP